MDEMTTKEAADALEVTAGRIRQMVLSGELPAEKRGRDLFVKRADVLKLKGRKKSPGPAAKNRPRPGRPPKK